MRLHRLTLGWGCGSGSAVGFAGVVFVGVGFGDVGVGFMDAFFAVVAFGLGLRPLTCLDILLL